MYVSGWCKLNKLLEDGTIVSIYQGLESFRVAQSDMVDKSVFLREFQLSNSHLASTQDITPVPFHFFQLGLKKWSNAQKN